MTLQTRFAAWIALASALALSMSAPALAQKTSAKELSYAVSSARTQLLSAEETIATLDSLEHQSVPAATSADSAYERWVSGVRTRVSAQAAALRRTLAAASRQASDTAGERRLIADLDKMNAQFLSLQRAVARESRRFQTLSNASKARHEAAMNAIRNMKG